MSGSDRQQVTLLNMLERIRSNESHNPFLVCIDNDIDSFTVRHLFWKEKRKSGFHEDGVAENMYHDIMRFFYKKYISRP